MASIKASEVSEVLARELSNFSLDQRYEEVGQVLEVGDGIARIYGLERAESSELVEFESGVRGVVLNLEEDNVGVVLLGESEKVREGQTVKRTGRIASIRVGEGLLGRIVNTLGEPIDGRGPVVGETIELPLERKAPGVIFRQPVDEPLQTGLKAVDALVPIGRGQRELIIGDRQTGKTAIAIDAIINQRANYEAGRPVYCIYVAVGQKGSTVANLVQTLERAGAMEYTVVIMASASDPAAQQFYAPFAGAAIGEYFPIIETQAGDVSAYIPTNVISITDGQIFLESTLFNAGVRPAINVGISVSRVGGNAQIKAMKKVAGTLKLDQAQYRELEAFSKFGSELDAATKNVLDRGAKNVEVLKQPQYSPMPVEEQVAIIFCGSNGLLRDVAVDKVQAFEKAFLQALRLDHADLLARLHGGKLSDEDANVLRDVAARTASDFAAAAASAEANQSGE